jgi:adenylosuccinate synthase
MPAHIIVGTQWGDEGKGRVADYFAARSDIVARYAGGDNAGHTIRVGEEAYALHIVPSGIVHDGVVCVMGNGMVVNPLKLADEMRGLEERGIDIAPGRVLLAESAHLILPTHRALDRAREVSRGRDAIGTTARGIGPAYTDKVARAGLRAGSMGRPDDFAALARGRVAHHNRLLEERYGAEPVGVEATVGELVEAAAFLAPYLADTPLYLHGALAAGRTVLCEGAQGTLLDLDHGTYPYVTSSSATAGGALTGLGIGPKQVARVTGVAKAFSTRVGEGPFPTELSGPLADRLRGTGENPWDEFGTTTGRPRRCGWLDTVVVRYAARINGLTDLILTKLDILSGLDELNVADAYTCAGETIREMPRDRVRLEACDPVYEALPGWDEDITGAARRGDLPGEALGYIARIEAASGVPVAQVTVGPGRAQAIEVL